MTAAPDRRTFAKLIAVLIMVEVMSSLEASMIYTALPTIARAIGDAQAAGWLVTIFLLIQAATAAVGGRLGDLYGRKRVLAIVVGLCALGSLISGVTDHLGVMIGGRALQGLSGAILPLCYGIVRQAAGSERGPFWIGVLTGAWSFAAAIGYILGGWLADTGEWRAIFWTTAAYGALILPPLLLFVPELRNPNADRRLDLIGGLLFVPAVALALYALTISGQLGWRDGSVWAYLGAGLGLTGIWVFYELRHPAPLIDLRLLRRPQVAVGNLCGVFLGLGMLQLPLVSMMILQQSSETGVGIGVSATLAGVLKLPSNVAALVAATLSGWIAGRYGSRRAVLLGGVVAVAAWTFLFFFHDTLIQVVSGTIAAAFASTMLLAGLPNLVLEGAPVDRSSEVTGLAAVFRGIASAAAAQILTTLLYSSTVPAAGGVNQVPSEFGYQLAFAYVALTALGVTLASLLLRRYVAEPPSVRTPSPAAV